ncbi:MAG: ABC transporter ATP-binding protein [Alphaproteobacteria bacterium]|nr:ABC transporter ATP-binding protein [Alphaproteobacteria bacterium]
MLRVAAIHAAYGSVPVLNGIDLGLERGEILALLGRNGVGKTTLMRVLIGVLKATSGTIELAGQEVSRLAPHRIAHLGIAYVPQGRGIFPRLSVLENLKVGTRARGDGKEIVPEEIFVYFPVLKARLTQTGGTLSGGEQQMLAFARALCGAPKVMLLDEPSEGIQPNIVQELGRLIATFASERGIAVILVEQNIDLALQVAHRATIMEKGRIVHEGRPEELRDEAVLRRYLAI